MNRRPLLILFFAALGGAALAAPASLATPDGLVPVHSRHLDELHLRPGADLASYRRVMIDPVRVAYHKDWLGNMYDPRNVTRPIGQDNIKRFAEDTAASAQTGIADAFRTRGYEIAAAPGPGVLHVSASVADLYVNAPDRLSPWTTKTFTRDAGEAVLFLEARDSVSGTLLGRVMHHAKAQQMGRLTRASDVSNRFWFDAMFIRWATNCVAEFEAGRNRP